MATKQINKELSFWDNELITEYRDELLSHDSPFIQKAKLKIFKEGGEKLIDFTRYTKPDYKANFHHTAIAESIEQFYLSSEVNKMMIFAPPQHGKALEVSTPVLTTEGFKNHGDLVPGDYVFGLDGSPVKVEAVQTPYLHPSMVLSFQNKSSIVAAREHEWIVDCDRERYKSSSQGRVREILETQNIFKEKHSDIPIIPLGTPTSGFAAQSPPNMNGFFIKEVTDCGSRFVNCIQVEGGIYLAGWELIPTHNSELSSRRFPSWALGKDPNLLIALCAYNSDFSRKFNRNVQRIIDDDLYRDCFPETRLNSSNVKTAAKGSYLRNADEFEVVEFTGAFRTVGVQGPLTGTTVDIGIIDDPIKDRMEANSLTFRRRLWEWYTDVFETRLHNESKQLITLTRWHHDDLAGRILDRDGELSEGGEWKVITFEAIKETMGNHPVDDANRKLGEALWDSRHSLEKLEKYKRTAPSTFVSLYQQKPTPTEGNIVKRHWLQRYYLHELPNTIRKKVIIDPSESTKTEADPMGVMCYANFQNNFYILDYQNYKVEAQDKVPEIESFVKRNDPTKRMMVHIENKGGGVSLRQTIKRLTQLNVKPYDPGKNSKQERLEENIDYFEGGRIFVPHNAPWVDAFIDSVTMFPGASHDEEVDCLTGMLRIELKTTRNRTRLET